MHRVIRLPQTPSFRRTSIGQPPSWRRGIICSLVVAPTLLLLLSVSGTAHAGSATWNLNPASGDWNTAANWTPATVPNGSEDGATFDVSSITDVSLSATVIINRIVFNPRASAFAITVPPPNPLLTILEIGGAGISNDSNTVQAFITDRGYITFLHTATAGALTSFTNLGGDTSSAGGVTQFGGNSDAGNATFTNQPPLQPGSGGLTQFFNNATAANAMVINAGGGNGANGGETDFFDSSDAGSGTFVSEAGTAAGSFGNGQTRFFNTASAANGTFIAYGGMTTSAFGGLIDFGESSTASSAILIANGAQNGGLPGWIKFEGSSEGGTAQVKVFGDGLVDLTFHTAPGVTIGSIAGDGQIFLSIFNLTIGRGGFDSRFEGTISDVQGRGSLTKIGTGNLVLTNANIYAGGTTINGGKLGVKNSTGSGTGSGPVQVNAGTLGGTGIIAGAVTVGTGSGAGAFLSPGANPISHRTLTIASSLTFNSDATYRCGFNSSTSRADKVVANGVTINGGAQFSFQDSNASVLPLGTVFTVIDNTAAAPIAGTFVNLADGSIFTVGSNTFQASYEGGDGNDLTLTVVP